MRRVRGGLLADRALDAAAARLAPRDRAWLQELVYGTLRLRGRIDHLLEARVKGGLERLEADVVDVLRLGAYQLLEMGSVPAYAAVSQSQELARAAGVGRAAALVGGVLHAIDRGGRGIAFPAIEADPLGHLASWGSHPRWLIERWLRRWGAADTAALVAANNRRPELFLRPLGVSTPEARDRLAEAGIETDAVEFCPSSVRVRPPATAADALAVVPAVVQDPGAALVVDYAAIPAGARVVDLCAAPGGKAIGLAERAGYVAAADLSARRQRRLQENAARLQLGGRVGAVVADGRRPPFRRDGVDVVLLDVPCTGTGTLRRHPDGRWRLLPEHVPQLVALQTELLDVAATLVRPAGLLVYSTCSLEEEENEVQVERFLADHEGWRNEPAGTVDAGLVDDAGSLAVLPQREGVDGAFAARLRRPG